MIWEQLEEYDALSARAAAVLLDASRTNPHLVLGLPTGRTPTGMYQRVAAECGASHVISSAAGCETSGKVEKPCA